MGVDKDRQSDGTNQLYAVRSGMVDEYWWQPWQPLHGNRLVTADHITAFTKDKGAARAYLGHNANVLEAWWDASGIHTDWIVTLN